MTKNTLFSLCFFTLCGLLLMPVRTWAQNGSPALGDTQVAKWKDGKHAAFMLMFDDCCPSHVTNVFPELLQRKMTGTFYVVVNKPERLARQSFWEKDAPVSPYVVYGNHTLNHRAFKDAADAEREIVGCNEFILRIMPGKDRRLISYATPGGAKHATTADELAAILGRHDMIERPSFQGHGAAIHFKTAADILKAVDKAISGGTSEYVIFHGVGGDWLSFDEAQFVALLDGLETRRSEVWITDHISMHKYEKERDSAKVGVTKADTRKILIELTVGTEAALYDESLTLITHVPASWKECQVSQGERKTIVPVAEGTVCYDAMPGPASILLTAAN